MTTGVKSARLIPDDEMTGRRSAAAQAMHDEAVARDAALGSAAAAAPQQEPQAPPADPAGDTAIASDEDAADLARRVLLELPQPPEELVRAAAAGVSGDELDALLRRTWARRQAELAEAAAAISDDASAMQAYLRALATTAGLEYGGGSASDAVQLRGDALAARLEDLQWLVSSIDNAVDFAALRGLPVIVELLQHNATEAVHGAAWVLGTAVRHHAPLQEAATALGGVPALLDALHTAVRAGDGRTATKCVFALTALARGCPAAQEQLAALVGEGGRHAAAVRQVLSGAGDAEDADALRKARFRMVSMLGDLSRDPWNAPLAADALGGARDVLEPGVTVSVDALGDALGEAHAPADDGVAITHLSSDGTALAAGSEGDDDAAAGTSGAVRELLESAVVCDGAVAALRDARPGDEQQRAVAAASDLKHHCAGALREGEAQAALRGVDAAWRAEAASADDGECYAGHEAHADLRQLLHQL